MIFYWEPIIFLLPETRTAKFYKIKVLKHKINGLTESIMYTHIALITSLVSDKVPSFLIYLNMSIINQD